MLISGLRTSGRSEEGPSILWSTLLWYFTGIHIPTRTSPLSSWSCLITLLKLSAPWSLMSFIDLSNTARVKTPFSVAWNRIDMGSWRTHEEDGRNRNWFSYRHDCIRTALDSSFSVLMTNSGAYITAWGWSLSYHISLYHDDNLSRDKFSWRYHFPVLIQAWVRLLLKYTYTPSMIVTYSTLCRPFFVLWWNCPLLATLHPTERCCEFDWWSTKFKTTSARAWLLITWRQILARDIRHSSDSKTCDGKLLGSVIGCSAGLQLGAVKCVIRKSGAYP